jgi:phenolphthiocerol/phthiocerol/phthiodiolone dimycocerosyl transferase
MRRALCPVETLYVGQRSRAVMSSTLRGHVDVEALSAAFDAVTGAHPSLRTRIDPDGEGFALTLLEDAERPRLTTRTGETEDNWMAELNTPLSVGGPVSRAVLVSEPEGEGHLFVLLLDHAVTDGHSAVALHNEIWARYGDAVADGERPGAAAGAPDDAPAWPAPVSRLLSDTDPADTATYLDRRVDEARRLPVELVPYDVADPTAAEGHIEASRLTLDEEWTNRLRRTARRLGVSVHALISATMLVTARRRLPGDDPRVLGCLSPADLRSRLSPPLPALVMVPAVTTHLQRLGVAPDADLVELARTVHNSVKEFVSGADLHHEARITPEISGNPALQLATVIVTNMGVVPGPRLPEGLEATDVRLVPGREQYFPQAGRSPMMACVASFDGRLSIEFPHFTACFSPAFIRAFRDEVHQVLVAFTGATEPVAAQAG